LNFLTIYCAVFTVELTFAQVERICSLSLSLLRSLPLPLLTSCELFLSEKSLAQLKLGLCQEMG
jgi:hypothetical protein